MAEEVGRPPRRDGVALAAAAMVLYLALAQRALHGLDVHLLVFLLGQGRLEHPYHLLFLKVVGVVHEVLGPLGLTPLQTIRAACALGTALGVWFLHRAGAAAGMARADAAVAAAAAAVAPAVVFFATVAEIHGVFQACAGLAWLAWARVVAVPSAARIAALGAATGVSASLHATGHLLLGLAAAAALAWWGAARPRPRRLAMLMAMAMAVHFGTAVGLAAVLQPDGGARPFGGQLAYLAQTVEWLQSWRSLPTVAWNEWLFAYLPTSITLLLATAFGRARAAAGWTAAALAVYLLVSWVLLDDIDERGAYLLPLAWPAAWITARAFGRRTLLAAAVVALIAAVAQVKVHDLSAGPAARVAAIDRLYRERPFAILCLGAREQDLISRGAAAAPSLRLDSLVWSAGQGEQAYRDFCQVFDLYLQRFRGEGRMLLISAAAHDAMRNSGLPFFTRFLSEHLQRYRLRRDESDGFAYWVVE